MNGSVPTAVVRPLRLGFLGVGWIGLHRMRTLVQTGLVEAVAVADPSNLVAEEIRRISRSTKHLENLEALLSEELDGVVIATPSAQHADQAIKALNAGIAVFCQKPLGRTAIEVRAVVSAAKAADRLLGVDLSYRHTTAMQRIRQVIRQGKLGKVFAIDLTFHNAYGPDKPWFYDKDLSGGGCVIDLGVHLIDLALWTFDFPKITALSSRLLRSGERLGPQTTEVEDFATATFDLENGATVRLACSWRLPLGCDAMIEANFFGTSGGCGFRNIDGSFYDFRAERYHGTEKCRMAEPPDDWGGRAALAWVARLAQSKAYDCDCETIVTVADAIDRIYGIG